MNKNPMSTNKLFLEVLPDSVSQAEISDIFSKDRLKLLNQNGLNTAFIISSEPVEPKSYLVMIQLLKKAGIQVMSFYFDKPDERHVDSLRSAVRDLQQALNRGGCLIVSYRSKFALALIASLHIFNGATVDEAIAAVTRIKKGTSELQQYRHVLNMFHALHARPHDEEKHVRDAIRINRSSAGISAAPSVNRAERPSGPIATPVMMPVIADSASLGKLQPVEADVGEQPARKQKPAPAATVTDTSKYAKINPADMRSGPFYRSIRFKLISIISIIIMASLTGMIFLASYFFKNDNKIRIQESNLQISEVIAMKMKTEIEKYQITSSVMLKEKNESMTGYENLFAAGEKEVLFAGIIKQSEKTGELKFEKTFYNKPLMNKFMISEKDIMALNDTNSKNYSLSFAGEPLINNVSPYLNNPAFSICFPYEHDANGVVKSIMVGYIRLDIIMKTFQTTGITQVFMVNYKGDIIVHPDLNTVKTGSNIASLPICSMMMKSKMDNGQTRYNDAKGVFYLGSFKKIDVGGFGIIATANEKDAFKAVYDIQMRNIIILGMVLTGAILFIFFFGKTITTPIVRLVGATKKIINGEYRVDIMPTSRDEIGQLTSTFIEMGKGLEEREKIKNAFGKFVNKEIAEAALRDELRLGGERKTVAILFSDIRSFTAISEKLEPEEVVEFLNKYMTKMVACVEGNNGIVDKFIGDAIMAVWGTPISKGNDTEYAINSALDMRRELILFNKDRGGPKKPAIQIGCGINTGNVLAGQIGSENRMEYTVIGDCVNLASRLESLNKPFGTDILISEDSHNLVKGIFAVEKMKEIKVKGKMEPQQVYAVLGRADDPTRPKSINELQSMMGFASNANLSDDAITQMIDRGEEKYEIIEK
jgi:adenylate cyclase